jgi:NADPH:quinone reductase-like Zn-dependent oxidoreductase
MPSAAADVIRGIQQGWLRMAETTDFALKDAALAHAALDGRASQGKLALIA